MFISFPVRNHRLRQLIIFFRHRPRLMTSMAATLLLGVCLQYVPYWSAVTAWIAAWNIGIVLFLGLIWRASAQAKGVLSEWLLHTEDEGAWVMVLVVLASLSVSLIAIVRELAVAQHLGGNLKLGHLLLTVLTIMLSWLLVQIMFALHYAHVYQSQRKTGGAPELAFPDTSNPLWGDFVYFACIIGTSGQTADVSFASSRARRIGTIHCVLAFFYNAMILASMINIAAGLAGS